jgi:hypothetical protein
MSEQTLRQCLIIKYVWENGGENCEREQIN